MYLPPSAGMTANILLLFDQLFDSFNKKENKEFNSIINSLSNHILFWKNAVNRIHKMDFVDSTTHKYIRHNAKCLKNWIWTIKGAQYLWNTLQTCRFSSFNLRLLNQDVAENCFSQVRDHGHRYNNPTPYQFCASFKTLITTNLTCKHSLSANCKENNEGTALSLTTIISATENIEDEEDQETECTEASIPPLTKCKVFVDTEKILKNIFTNKTIMQCAECIESLKNKDVLKNIEHALKTAEVQFVNLCYTTKVKKKLKSIIYLEAFSKLPTHCEIQLECLIEETAQQFIIQWCTFINKILNGKLQEDYENNYMYNEAKNMSMKYTKRTNVKKK